MNEAGVNEAGPAGPTEWLERHQVSCYLGALAVGIAAGLSLPQLAPAARTLITPALGLLLYATFLQVPIRCLAGAWSDRRFLGAVLAVNFVAVPLVVAGLFPLVPADPGVRLGVLLVLLCPCVDYVIVFTGLAGGDRSRLLAATPLLLILQFLLLPPLLWLFLGRGLADTVDSGPFLTAFAVLIVLPLLAAWLTQSAAVHGRTAPIARRLTRAGEVSMVPLMMLVLAAVAAAAVPDLEGRLRELLPVAGLFLLFAVIMTVVGTVFSARVRLDVPGRRALIFSGVTRNSLVVLPLALALPAGLQIAAAAVVTQTLVELVVMVAGVRLVPRLVSGRV